MTFKEFAERRLLARAIMQGVPLFNLEREAKWLYEEFTADPFDNQVAIKRSCIEFDWNELHY